MADTTRTSYSSIPPEAMPASPGDMGIADLASESVIVFDVAGIIRYWNPASETLYGWPALAVTGGDPGFLSTNAADDAEHWRLLLQEGKWEGTVQRRTAAGTHITAAIRQTVRCNPDGTRRDIVEYGRWARTDIWHATSPDASFNHFMAACWELDTHEARPLLESIAVLRRRGLGERRMRQPQWADELLKATRIVDVNDRTVRVVGGDATREEMIGQSVAAFWPVESRSILAELLVDAATDCTAAGPWTREIASDGILRDPVVTVWRRADRGLSDIIFVAVRGGPDDDRSFWYVRASEERYRKLIHAMPVALWQVDASGMEPIFAEIRAGGVTDLDLYIASHPELVELACDTVRVTEINLNAILLFGGNGPADFIRPVRYLFAEAKETLRRVMVARFNGQRNYGELTKVRTFDGRLLDVQLSVTYPTPPEQLDVTLLCIEDVSDRLRTEAQLRQLQADFAHAARVFTLGELTTSIAHEVNQPLAAIVTNAETSLRWLARADPNIAKVEQLTSRIVASARRANEIVQRIRGMAAKHRPERAPLDLNEIAREALLFMRHEIESQSIEVSANFDCPLPIVIGDRVQLQQVIVNLLLNSVQAIEQRGGDDRRIELGTSLDREGQVVFSIHDSGPGIPATDLERIFDGFFTTKEGGMGIGLAICQSIIAAHGGTIVASNHPDGGAQVRFAIPAAVAC